MSFEWVLAAAAVVGAVLTVVVFVSWLREYRRIKPALTCPNCDGPRPEESGRDYCDLCGCPGVFT